MLSPVSSYILIVGNFLQSFKTSPLVRQIKFNGSKIWGKGVSHPQTRWMGASRFRKQCSCDKSRIRKCKLWRKQQSSLFFSTTATLWGRKKVAVVERWPLAEVRLYYYNSFEFLWKWPGENPDPQPLVTALHTLQSMSSGNTCGTIFLSIPVKVD